MREAVLTAVPSTLQVPVRAASHSAAVAASFATNESPGNKAGTAAGAKAAAGPSASKVADVGAGDGAVRAAGANVNDGAGEGAGAGAEDGALHDAGDEASNGSGDGAGDGAGDEAGDEAGGIRQHADVVGGAGAKKVDVVDVREYTQFFRGLGMGDAKKVAFLAGMLRDFRNTAARLDSHLVGYSFSVRAAVSRLHSPTSPQAPPEHIRIRVHDSLGFFSDDDVHANRTINIGMSFASRHLEMDAIATSTEKVLHDVRLRADACLRASVPKSPVLEQAGGRAAADKPTTGDVALFDSPGSVGAAQPHGVVDYISCWSKRCDRTEFDGT